MLINIIFLLIPNKDTSMHEKNTKCGKKSTKVKMLSSQLYSFTSCHIHFDNLIEERIINNLTNIKKNHKRKYLRQIKYNLFYIINNFFSFKITKYVFPVELKLHILIKRVITYIFG